jgi:hypothetical protein
VFGLGSAILADHGWFGRIEVPMKLLALIERPVGAGSAVLALLVSL